MYFDDAMVYWLLGGLLGTPECRRWNALYRPKIGAAEIIQGLDDIYYI